MKRLIILLAAGTLACPSLFALQLIQESLLSASQVDQAERSIVKGLESSEPARQVEAVMTLHRVRGLAPTHGWDRCIIPLMHILNGETNEPATRLLAALVLHELRTERGDFAIARSAQFTDNVRVRRYCAILTRTRLIERSKL